MDVSYEYFVYCIVFYLNIQNSLFSKWSLILVQNVIFDQRRIFPCEI